MRCDHTCSNCVNITLCTSCKIGFYLHSNGTCVDCGGNCMACDTAGICFYCYNGYNLQDNCTTCASRFFFNTSHNFCDSCPNGC